MAPFDLVVATKSRSVPAVSSDRGVGIGKFAVVNAVDIIRDLNPLGVLPKISFKLTQSIHIASTDKRTDLWSRDFLI